VPEPSTETITQALVAALAGIVGDGGASYWYTPGAARVVSIGAACLDDTFADPTTGRATIYALEPGAIRTTNETTGSIDAVMEFDLLIASQIEQTDHPMRAPQGDSRNTVQNRLAADAERAIYADVTLGGICDFIEIPYIERSAGEVYVEGWAAVLMRLVVTFSYWKDTP